MPVGQNFVDIVVIASFENSFEKNIYDLSLEANTKRAISIRGGSLNKGLNVHCLCIDLLAALLLIVGGGDSGEERGETIDTSTIREIHQRLAEHIKTIHIQLQYNKIGLQQ